MANPSRETIIEAHISEALGDMAGWIRPSIRKSVGPYAPEVFEDFEGMLAQFKADAQAALGSCLLDGKFAVEADQSASGYNPLQDRDGVLHHLAEQLVALQRARPPWFAGGWSVFGRRPDWEYWRSSRTLTLEEASLLLIDVDPQKASIEELFSRYGEHPGGDAALYFLEDRYYALARGLDVDNDPSVSIGVEQLFGWAAEYEIHIPREARTAFSQYFPKKAATDDATSSVNDELAHGRSVAMFQRIIATMAVAHFGMKSEDDAGKIAQLIEREGLLLGFKPTARRIRSHLIAGFKQIPEEARSKLEE